MSYLIVPHDVSPTTAAVWVAIAGLPHPPGSVVLEAGSQQKPLDTAAWRRWTSDDGSCVLHYQRVSLTGLTPNTSYPLGVRARGSVQATGSLTTLPSRLPGVHEPPFTVLLGSCFCAARPQSHAAGHTYFHMPHPRRPTLKFLCGDQVYLDDPAFHYLRHTHSRVELQVRFFENYFRTWTQGDVASGFNQILRSGATYFTPDDHELWNNAPNFGTLIRDTWRQAGRDAWKEAAQTLYRIFQTERTLTQLAVDRLSFLVVDTRMDRMPGSREFMSRADMDRLGEWVGMLKGPGVLVIGQPVFDTRRNWFSQTLVDRALPDYDQYAELVRYLKDSRHSILVLTGDVHYGRLATCVLQPGLEIVEVISSPMALVDERVGGRWSPAPAQFPAMALPDVPQLPITTDQTWNRANNHFVTLEFAAVGEAVRVEILDWRIASVPEADRVGRVVLR